MAEWCSTTNRISHSSRDSVQLSCTRAFPRQPHTPETVSPWQMSLVSLSLSASLLASVLSQRTGTFPEWSLFLISLQSLCLLVSSAASFFDVALVRGRGRRQSPLKDQDPPACSTVPAHRDPLRNCVRHFPPLACPASLSVSRIGSVHTS